MTALTNPASNTLLPRSRAVNSRKPLRAPETRQKPCHPGSARQVRSRRKDMLKTKTAAASPPADRPIDQVWVEYKMTGDATLRNTLIECYLPMVRYYAERIHVKLPEMIDINDLICAGVFGLTDAIQAFDSERGVEFETYCVPRVRGAIFDELRSMDWVPRLVRSRITEVAQARKSLEMQLGRPPTDDELADTMGVSKDEYQKICNAARVAGIVSLSRKRFETTDSNKAMHEIDVLEDARQVNPLSIVQKRDLKRLITKGLSRAEQLIVILYYYEQLTMKEIGLTLDLHESRVCQMHRSILARLKARFRHRREEFHAGAA